jgi:hypothetical protein
MVAKKLFVLASVTALTGFVAAAGCSSTETITLATDAGPGGSKTDAKKSTTSSGSIAGDDDDDDDGGPVAPVKSCLNTTPIDQTKYAYIPAITPMKNACTDTETAAISAYYKAHGADASFKVTDWMATVSQGCASCIFTTEPDDGGAAPAWGPIVVKPNAQNVLSIDTVNRGGCIELVSGSAPCGRAYQQYQDCTLDACLLSCKSQAEFNACRQDANVLTTACKDAFAAVKTVCGGQSAVQGYEAQCKGPTYTFEGPIKIMCQTGATPPHDAGTDADADH